MISEFRDTVDFAEFVKEASSAPIGPHLFKQVC
jgi:hypothetical protein